VSRDGPALASLMTLAEREAYLHPGALNVTWGYPEGLTPQWMRHVQEHPPGGFLDHAPGQYETVIGGYFRRLLGCRDVLLAPTCSMAFAIAAQAVMRGPGGNFVLAATSFEPYAGLLASLGAGFVNYARRGANGLPDAASIAEAAVPGTVAVVIVSPDNPLGVVYPRRLLEQVAGFCAGRGIALIADHCLAEVRPSGCPVPLLPRALRGHRVTYAALGDTGKLLGLAGTKIAAVACSPDLRERAEAAASQWFSGHSQYDLAVLAAILGDARLGAYKRMLRDRVTANCEHLRQESPLEVTYGGAGSFCLVDAWPLTCLSDTGFAACLRERHGVLTVPVSWFPGGQSGPEGRVRVALTRPAADIRRLAAALTTAAGELA
jgi:aspartate/methionine/tyrosine aminotransferase